MKGEQESWEKREKNVFLRKSQVHALLRGEKGSKTNKKKRDDHGKQEHRGATVFNR